MFRRFAALLPALLLVSVLVMSSGTALAQFDDRFCANGGGGTAFCDPENQADGDETDNDFVGQDSLLYTVTEYVTTITIVAAIIVMLIASIMYITSNGDASRAGRARSAIIYASIGLAISVVVRQVVIFALSQVSDAT